MLQIRFTKLCLMLYWPRPMIKHIVMWKLKEDVAKESLLKFKALLEAMQDKVEGLQTLEVGVNVVPLDAACDLVLYSEFDSMEALDRYQNHRDHLKIKPAAKACVLYRSQVDYVVD